jgi:hypothetical protein
MNVRKSFLEPRASTGEIGRRELLGDLNIEPKNESIQSIFRHKFLKNMKNQASLGQKNIPSPIPPLKGHSAQ